WRGYGGEGPLLEFVYFVTQNQTLKDRIEIQVQTLQDRARLGEIVANERHLLRLVAVASAYAERLDLQTLVQHLKLNEPKRTLELYEREYLIRISESNATVAGLHAVRSSIMLNSCLDDVLLKWESVAHECLPLLVEADLEIFLMYAFSRRRGEVAALIEGL